jgi:hypothetical protein
VWTEPRLGSLAYELTHGPNPLVARGTLPHGV